MKDSKNGSSPDFRGIGHSKIGYFREVRQKIKELEKLNLELGRRTNWLETIFNSINDGITILNRNFNIVFVNHVQSSMFPHTSLLGKKCYEAYFNRSKICPQCPGIRAFEEKKVLQGEKVIKRGDQRLLYLDWTVSPIVEASGKVSEIILVVRDVTKRKEYEHKAMHSDRMAAIGFLAAGIAHEINNPLTSIAGFTEGLYKRLGKLDKENFEKHKARLFDYLNIILNETYRCQAIVERLQEFSQDSQLEFVNLSIAKIVEDSLALLRQQAKDQGVKVIFENKLNKGFGKIRGKESQLKHVFLSLFIKVLNSMENSKVLTVKAFNQADQVVIIIISNTESVERPKFESYNFSNLESLSLQEGLESQHIVDLSICYTIIQYHKGTISQYIAQRGQHVYALKFPVCFESTSRNSDLKVWEEPA